MAIAIAYLAVRVVTFCEIPSNVSCTASGIAFWNHLPDLYKPPSLSGGSVHSQDIYIPNLSVPIQNDIQVLMSHA